jgi:hypothetical protein
VHDAFSASLLEDDDVGMDDYLLAYKELYKWVYILWKILYAMNIGDCTEYGTREHSDKFFLFLHCIWKKRHGRADRI